MFCVGPNRKRKSLDNADNPSSAVRPPVMGGPAVGSPSGVLGNPFKSMRLSPIPKTADDHGTPKRRKHSGATTSSSSEDMAGFDSVPMVEMVTRDALWTGGDMAGARLCQPYKGQLKLSVYMNCGHLTVHVIKARHLHSKFRRICDTYVKVSLAPEDSTRPQWKTETIYDTNNPLFDEKFSLEVVDGDLKKRLLITAWCRDAGGTGATEFLGCMSFGVKSIYSDSKSVSGWYYLLADEVGRRKHLQVVTRKAALHDRPPAVVPKLNQDLKFMDPHLLVLKKGKNGYGFTVSGNSPVKVCRVDAGSPAEAAGLKPDDCIVRIDGLNVSRSTSDSVARIIKHTGKQLVLEVQRAHSVQKMVSSPWKPMSMSTPRYQPGTEPPEKRRQFGTNLPQMQNFDTDNQPPAKSHRSDCRDNISSMPPYLSSTTPITGNLHNPRVNRYPYHGAASQEPSYVLRTSEEYPPFHDFLREDIENTPMIPPPHAGMWKPQDQIENVPILPQDVWQAYRTHTQMNNEPDALYNYYNIDLPPPQPQFPYQRQPHRQTGKRVTFKDSS